MGDLINSCSKHYLFQPSRTNKEPSILKLQPQFECDPLQFAGTFDHSPGTLGRLSIQANVRPNSIFTEMFRNNRLITALSSHEHIHMFLSCSCGTLTSLFFPCIFPPPITCSHLSPPCCHRGCKEASTEHNKTGGGGVASTTISMLQIGVAVACGFLG